MNQLPLRKTETIENKTGIIVQLEIKAKHRKKEQREDERKRERQEKCKRRKEENRKKPNQKLS